MANAGLAVVPASRAERFHAREEIVVLPAIVVADSDLREQSFLPAAGVEEALHRIGAEIFFVVNRRAAGGVTANDPEFLEEREDFG